MVYLKLCAIGNATAREITFAPRDERVAICPNRKWNSLVSVMDHEFLNLNNGERVLDDRVLFHHVATGITPSMAAPKVRAGSVYRMASQDSDGEYPDGGKMYRVTLAAPVLVNNFWSFMVYSGQHRSMLETNKKPAGLDSNDPSIKPNDDGFYTIWLGPKAPKGHEGNWIQTIPGESLFSLLRLYGPLEPWFDKSWNLVILR